MNTRAITGKYWEASSKTWIFTKGHFHCWGTTFEEFSNSAVEVTVAIIELPNGKVVLCPPENIAFICPLSMEGL